MKTTFTLAMASLIQLAGLPAESGAAATQPAGSDYTKQGFAFLEKHCFRCHGQKTHKAKLSLYTYRDEPSVLEGRKVLENAVKKVQAGEMPPVKEPRPAATEIDAFVKAVNGVFAKNNRLDPGHIAVRRLNRVEYKNTIRDLFGRDLFADGFDATEDFPADDVGHGFEIGAVLSPLLLERYLAAAEAIVQRAILVGTPPEPPKRIVPPDILDTTKKEPVRPGTPFRSLATKGEIFPRRPFELTVAGEHKVRVFAGGRQVGDEPVKIAFRIDGKEVGTAEIKATKEKPSVYDSPWVKLEPGKNHVAVAFLNEFAKGESKRELFVMALFLVGPKDTTPLAHKRIMACKPKQSEREKAREILTRFVSRAYRRPAKADEVERLLNWSEAEAKGATFEARIQLALQAVLVSNEFLFRLELDSQPQNDKPHPLDDYQLASRLSYFLWSTMPDEELFDLAVKKQLRSQLDAQVRRMLRDPKASALTENFALQWLQLRRLQSAAPDAKLFPSFNAELRSAMLRETELFFAEIVREDRSILDLIDADFTWLNEPLARHYAIADTNGNGVGQQPAKPGGQPIRGPEFVRVRLQGKTRGGLLTQASILTATSNPTRTSPVKRGRWVLEQLLGDPQLAPPPDVPEFPENDRAALSGSLRQRMAQHRANPRCAGCHNKMDPLGFAFENFDAIGAFRNKDGTFDIDASGTLPDGQSFRGPEELKTILKNNKKKDPFARNLAEKMLTYALGRGVEYYDRPTLDRIVAALARSDYKFSTLATEIAKSEPFLLRRGKELAK